MSLYEGTVGRVYVVCSMQMEVGIMRRLQALGMNEGTRVKILNRKRSGAMIVSLRGTRLALGKQITSGIEAEEETGNGER